MRVAEVLAGLAGLLVAGLAPAQQPLTVEVRPDEGTQFAVQCTKEDTTVIEHAGAEEQVFGFDSGPVDCRVRVVGDGGIRVEASGPASQTQSVSRGRDLVVTFTVR